MPFSALDVCLLPSLMSLGCRRLLTCAMLVGGWVDPCIICFDPGCCSCTGITTKTSSTTPSSFTKKRWSFGPRCLGRTIPTQSKLYPISLWHRKSSLPHDALDFRLSTIRLTVPSYPIDTQPACWCTWRGLREGPQCMWLCHER
jgi:hypothetical protein